MFGNHVTSLSSSYVNGELAPREHGRVAEHLLTVALRGVAGADRYLQLGCDPPQWGAEVSIDVVGERL